LVVVLAMLSVFVLVAQTPELAEFGIAISIAAPNIEPSSNKREF
jgi:hypothetical protein